MPRPPIATKGQIRDIALELIDMDGLDALSMRMLAKRVGIRAQSLYTHFPNKDALLDAIANLITSQVDTSGFDGGDWQHGLRMWGMSYHVALAAHPRAAPIITAGAGSRADFLAMADAAHGGLVRAGWSPRQATLICGAVKYLVVGAVATPFAEGFADEPSVYADLYPNLTGAHLLRERAVDINRESFELGLDCLIAGLAAKQTRAPKRRPRYKSTQTS